MAPASAAGAVASVPCQTAAPVFDVGIAENVATAAIARAKAKLRIDSPISECWRTLASLAPSRIRIQRERVADGDANRR